MRACTAMNPVKICECRFNRGKTMNQIIDELKTDNEALRKVIQDLADVNGQMTVALLGRLARDQQAAIDRQELQIAALKRELKALGESVVNTAMAVTREADKRQLAFNLVEDNHKRLVDRLKVKFEGEAK